MEPARLVEAAVQLLKTFRPAVDTVDTHVRAGLGSYSEVSPRAVCGARGQRVLRHGGVIPRRSGHAPRLMLP